MIKILAISGSLRAASFNTVVLSAAARLAPPNISVTLYQRLGALPLFNPDLEASDPRPVADLRSKIIAADALIIASPEYAHGISGVMKNALDWMVGCEAFVNKPVALLNTAPRAVLAYAALRETITVMSAQIVEDASIILPIFTSKLSVENLVVDTEIAAQLRASLIALVLAIEAKRMQSNFSAATL